ncbi:MAG: Crp/Fnr family transcriptional regulator [Alphaproteobacteria bacterium]|nr:Crp/Fnr family transcriptional regulator [Alphaproteobacteria bacterium]
MAETGSERALKVLRSMRWLQAHDPALPDAFLAAGRLVSVGPGGWAHGEGDIETGLIFVIEGALQLLTRVRGDREVLIGHVEEGGTIGQTVRFGGGPRLVTAICVKPSLLLIVSDAALTRLSRDRPDIWRVVTTLAYAQMRAVIRANAELVALPPRQRLAARLLALAAPKGSRTPLRLAIGQQSLAELIGVTRKTANGLLSSFAAQGLVRLGYRSIELLDLRGLTRMAEH